MLPSIDPEETLFSWGAKTKLALGLSARQMSLRYFSNVRAGYLPDLPPHMKSFALSPIGRSRSLESLVRRHSLYGPYLALAEKPRCDAFMRALERGQPNQAHLILGLRTSRLRSRHPLRYCSECAHLDLQSLGYSRWKVVHQIPASWVCTKHRLGLVELEVLERAWQLPLEESSPRQAQPISSRSMASLEIAAKVAQEQLALEQTWPHRIHAVVVARMVEVGIISNPARLSNTCMHAAFMGSAIAAHLASHSHHSERLLSDVTWVGDLLRSRTAPHPAYWPILWGWLWSDAPVAEAVSAFRLANLGDYQAEADPQMRLWPDSVEAGLQAGLTKVRVAMAGLETLPKLAEASGTTPGVLRSWMKQWPALRSSWEDAKLRNKCERLIAELLESIRAGSHANRGGFLRRHAGAIAFLRKHRAQDLCNLLKEIDARSPRQRSLLR
jgi:hypothetical protein